MFRVGACLLIVLAISLLFGCSDKTSEAQPTGLELGFMNCLSFNAHVFIDNSYVGSFSSERSWFIDVAAGKHSLFARANLAVDLPDTSFCWTTSFTVAEGATTQLRLNCSTGGCPAGN